MCCGNSILQKGLPFFYLHKIFYTLKKDENKRFSIKRRPIIFCLYLCEKRKRAQHIKLLLIVCLL
ncbi:hypothetical protein CYQ57_12565 [Enterococcus faecium]|nr:hypothetical protein CYQ57_12565 [Enterococcus faecium]TKN44525.1 hypothetical protein DVW98_12615 [Enterococcus faecium]TKN51974.1 hypothetical protein DVX13_12810 [Enterococcus faecium]TKN60802.1 hypothetical protein DVX04_12805 [Enterococcus faecium]TKN75382.1 hypothetical protein DVX19_12635 [Enterococcus faecium]